MINFRKIKKNAKALSPVVASIILIAVTVAVSIAVAAWMGGMSVGFMQTEQLSITNVAWTGAGANITVTVRNTGTTDIVLNSATVNSASAAIVGPSTGVSIAKNTAQDVVLTSAWLSGNSYQIKLVSSKGNNFLYSAVAS
jgi:flagellin-like protein